MSKRTWAHPRTIMLALLLAVAFTLLALSFFRQSGPSLTYGGIALVLLAVAAILSWRRHLTGSPASEYGKAFSTSMAMLEGGDLKSGLAGLRQLTKLDDHEIEQLMRFATSCERRQLSDTAEAIYSQILEHRPSSTAARSGRERVSALNKTVILQPSKHTTDRPATSAGTAAADASKTVGPYVLKRPLGKGAMGMVHLGVDTRNRTQVAIKTLALSQEFDDDELPEIRERFFREADAARHLQHPSIVQVLDAGEANGLAYIVMEYIDGEDLGHHVAPEHLLPLHEALSFIAAMADALDYAHSKGIIHRDIKPGNMMLSLHPRIVKLMDFGVARIADSSKTRTGTVLGSPNYMSPEQLAGKRVDGRSDLFSLGVTLYQLVTGTLPFRGDSLVTLMLKIAAEPYIPLSEARSDLPPALEKVIDRALTKSPEHRYQTGAEMARDIRAIIHSLNNH